MERCTTILSVPPRPTPSFRSGLCSTAQHSTAQPTPGGRTGQMEESSAALHFPQHAPSWPGPDCTQRERKEGSREEDRKKG